MTVLYVGYEGLFFSLSRWGRYLLIDWSFILSNFTDYATITLVYENAERSASG